jgi:hypothetical protein
MQRGRRMVLRYAGAWFASCGTAFADRESWSVNSAWVKELSAPEQAAALFALRGALNQHVIRYVAPNAMNSPRDFVWMLKLQAAASLMLSELATRNGELRRFFAEYADRLTHVIRTGDLSNYQADGNWANGQMKRFLSKIGEATLSSVSDEYSRQLKATATALIAFASIRARPPE